MDTQLCENCEKEVPSSSLELHLIHCKRNVLRCPDCNEPVARSSLDTHKQEKHIQRLCPHCKISFLPAALNSHDCPLVPRSCQFCEGSFPVDQFSDHLYQCSSRTQECPRCLKYIQIRDFNHHFEEVDCLNTRDSYEELLEKITEDVMKEFGDQPGFDIETEIMRRLAEDQDRTYAEELYKKLMMERSPSRDSHTEEAKERKIENFDSDLAEVINKSLAPDELPDPIPNIGREPSTDLWAGMTEEERMMNEVIMKSFQEK